MLKKAWIGLEEVDILAIGLLVKGKQMLKKHM